MTALNTSFFFSGSNNENILFNTPNFYTAFLHLLLMCGSNLNSLSIITPNSLRQI